MNTPIIQVTLSLFALTTVASCNQAPAKVVTKAQAVVQEKQAELNSQKVKLDQVQSEKRAELVHDQADQRVSFLADENKELALAKGRLATANAELLQAQKIFRSNTNRRIEEADSEANVVLARAAALPMKRRAAFDVAWKSYLTLRGDAIAISNRPLATTATEWTSIKPETEKILGKLEDSVVEAKKLI